MEDGIVIQSLYNKGFDFTNREALLMYEAPEHKPRVFDKPPKRLTLNRVKPDTHYNTYNELVMSYENAVQTKPVESGTLNIKGLVRPCDAKIYYVLQALITESFTSVEAKAEACFELFRIIMTTPGEAVTVEAVRNVLDAYTPNEFYVGELYKAIRYVLFDENTLITHWLELINYSNIFTNAVNLGKKHVASFDDIAALDKWLREQYTLYKEDTDFYNTHAKEFKRLGVSKALISMIHYLSPTNPEVLDIGDIIPGGFVN